jgi:hypothetical protein
MFEFIDIEAIVHWMLALGGIYILIIAVLMAAHHDENKRR